MNGSVFVFVELARTIARLSLLCMFVAFAAYTVAYVVLLVRFRLPAWTTAAAFREGKGQPWFRLLTFCQACAFVTPLFFVAWVAALDASAAPRYETLTHLALSAAVAFAVLSSVYYFVQFALAGAGATGPGGAALTQLAQLNPASVFAAVNILGWTLFFAVASLCLAPLFLGGGAGTSVLAGLLLLNGGVCLVGVAGYLGHVRALSVIFFNGMGLAVLGFSLAGLLVS